VIAAVEEGGIPPRAAARYGVSAAAALKWVHRFCETGSVAAKRMLAHDDKGGFAQGANGQS
jgi:transposase